MLPTTPASTRPRSRLYFLVAASLAAACTAGCAAQEADDEGEDLAEAEAAQSTGWTVLGEGVAYQRVGEGDAVFIGYGGYSARDPWVRAWSLELTRAKLASLGVGHVYAVRGPRDAGYAAREIGNRALGAHLDANAGPDAPFVLVAAHSSGSFVAHELFGQLRASRSPTLAKVVYANLDGGGGGLNNDIVRTMRRAAFVYAVDPTLSSGRSANAGAAEWLASTYGSAPVKLEVRNSGCNSGAKWCLHDLVIITRPHDPNRYDLARDYTQFAGRPVQTGWVDAVAADLQRGTR